MSECPNQGLDEQFYRELFGHSAEAILVIRLTEDGRADRIIDGNRQAVLLTGYSRDELLEKNPHDIVVQSEPDVFVPSCSAAQGDSPLTFTGTLLRRDDRKLMVEGTSCRCAIDGVPIMITVLREFCKRRQVCDLKEAVHEAREAENRQLANLLSRLSHELRTPLSGLIGMADLLLRAELGPTERQFAETIARSGEALQKLIDDLPRFEAHRSPPQSRPFDLAALVRRQAEGFSTEVARRGLAFALEMSELPARLVGAADILSLILKRLVEAALASHEAEGIRLRVEVEGPAANPCWVRISVGDADPVARGEDGAGDDRYQSGGLALTVAQALAEDLGGTLGVDRLAGPTFWARLPFGRDPEELWRGDPGARRVLVVEDDEVNQQVLLMMLRRMGLDVTLAPNGHKAVTLARGGGFGLILMDLHLPGQNGLDAARAIRREESPDRRSVIIATTACVFDEDRQKCLQAGMDDFLSKPFTGRELQEVISQWIALNPCF